MIFTNTIYAIADKLNFDACGITKISAIEDAQFYNSWLKSGYNGEMQYLERNVNLKFNPTLLLPEAKSVIMLAMSYYSEKNNSLIKNSEMKISRYALGKNYHNIIRKKLKKFQALLELKYPEIRLRPFVDTAPVLERYWAKKAGIGTIGKNTCLIIPKKGSWFFLAGMLCNIDFQSSSYIDKNYCGSCTKCIEACPTNAIVAPYTIDVRKCISYITIEKRGNLSESQKRLNQWVWGCDICQEVCPQNKNATLTRTKEFDTLPQILEIIQDKTILKEDFFENNLKGTSLYRGGYEQISRNINTLKK